jgi:hypothetical protein
MSRHWDDAETMNQRLAEATVVFESSYDVGMLDYIRAKKRGAELEVQTNE